MLTSQMIRVQTDNWLVNLKVLKSIFHPSFGGLKSAETQNPLLYMSRLKMYGADIEKQTIIVFQNFRLQFDRSLVSVRRSAVC